MGKDDRAKIIANIADRISPYIAEELGNIADIDPDFTVAALFKELYDYEPDLLTARASPAVRVPDQPIVLGRGEVKAGRPNVSLRRASPQNKV